jgi:hypothetical protein
VYQRHSQSAHTTMTAPHIANEPIRGHRTGPSARHGRTDDEAWIAAQLEIRNCVDSMKERSSWYYVRCGSCEPTKSTNPGGPRDVIPCNRPASQAVDREHPQ